MQASERYSEDLEPDDEDELYETEDMTDVELDFNVEHKREYEPDIGEKLSDFLDQEEDRRGSDEDEDN